MWQCSSLTLVTCWLVGLLACCLQTVPFLAGLTEAIVSSELDADQLKRFLEAMDTETFEKDAFIIRQGTTGDRFYMLEDGEVRFSGAVCRE